MKAAAVVAGLAALALLGMCRQSLPTVADAARVDPSLPAQPNTLGDDRAAVLVARALCHVRPSARAAVVARLIRGAQLEVLERRDGWVRVSPTGDDCWVAASQISEATAFDTAPAALYAPNVGDPPTTRRRPAARPTARRAGRRAGLYGGGSCPCGSGTICIGPRGGRYCLTSRGNKEYGQ